MCRTKENTLSKVIQTPTICILFQKSCLRFAPFCLCKQRRERIPPKTMSLLFPRPRGVGGRYLQFKPNMQKSRSLSKHCMYVRSRIQSLFCSHCYIRGEIWMQTGPKSHVPTAAWGFSTSPSSWLQSCLGGNCRCQMLWDVSIILKTGGVWTAHKVGLGFSVIQ